MPDPSLPCAELLRQQAQWLSAARSRLLRRVQIARRHSVLDLACGYGAVTGELVRRCGGRVVALDRSQQALCDPGPFAGATRVCADAHRIPFPAGSFDLVFCQFALLWLDARRALAEMHRVLEAGGAVVAIEPDYGGLIEHPPAIAARSLWLAALARAGADPLIGRKLPGLLAAAGFQAEVGLLDRLHAPAASRFEFLRDLPLAPDELERLRRIEAANAACEPSQRVVHLPLFLVAARK